MAIAKIIFDGVTQIDTTQVTVTDSDLYDGYTALGADGELITGTSKKKYTLTNLFTASNPSGALSSNISGAMKPYFHGRTGITSIDLPNVTSIPEYCFYGCTNLTSFSAPNCTSLGGSCLNASKLANIYFPKVTTIESLSFANTKLVYAIFPSLKTVYNNAFAPVTTLVGADFGGTPTSSQGLFKASIFSGCTNLNILVLRANTTWPLTNINVFTNTPFASGKTGGILYVPSAQISAYQAATNWSTILGYANNQIKSIESTATDPDATVDLTTHYVDGTLIPTT